LAQLFIRSFHADHERDAQIYRLASADHAFGNDVATHDAAKDIDKNRLYTFVLEHDLKGFGHFFSRSAAAHIQEVGWLAAEQLDGVHGSHRQTRPVHQAANVAVQLNISQIEFAGFDL